MFGRAIVVQFISQLREKGMKFGFAIIVVVAFATTFAFASESDDVVKRLDNGQVSIESSAFAPNSCYKAGGSHVGVPENATPVSHALLVTQELNYTSGGACLQVLTKVHFTISTSLPADAEAIVIYAVNSNTHSVSARAVSLPH